LPPKDAAIDASHQDDLVVLLASAELHAPTLGLAASPLSIVGFFAGWVLVGLLLARGLIRRGHHRPTMLALGVGLGPLLAVVSADGHRRRVEDAAPRLLRPGHDHGGPLHVLVLVPGAPAAASDLGPTVAAVAPDLGTLCVGRVVAYEELGGATPESETVQHAAAVVAAAAVLPDLGASLALWPGTTDEVAARFREAHAHSLVLVAADLPGAAGRGAA